MMDSFTASRSSAAFFISTWSPYAMVAGLWIIIMLTGLIITSSPAIAITEAADAAIPSIFTVTFPGYSESNFYEMEIGTAGMMRSYMARRCDIHFPLERKLKCFLTESMRVYRVPEEEQARVLAYIASMDIRAVAAGVMQKLFSMLEMKFDFRLSADSETEVTL